ncbi:MAG: cytochrome c [Pseudomonadales bacterium]|jgi:cytochrome c556|nr:cytochrome c [Pseudomonadales bacterium]
MKRIALTGAVLLGSLMSFNLVAAELSAEEQAAQNVANRQAIFKLLSVSNAPLGAMARGGAYDGDAAKLAAQRLAILGGMIPAAFEADTSGVTGLTTRASTTIWGNKADFDKLAGDLVTAANEALATLEAQGEAGVRGAVGAIGPKCGACHDRYRLD